ncbi:MAG TPA: DUF554 domain-containing protein [Oscillospiraceae bacterium]|nr:DUF554 domain-containing protein [Oscillospiraceae bacterium]
MFLILQGTIVNGIAIVVGGLLGVCLGHKMPERIKELIMQGISLAVLVIGMQMALQMQNAVLIIFSLIIGGVLGELIGIDEWLQRVGSWLEQRAARASSGLARAFVFATLVYVVGAMAVTGALESGLLGQHQTLYVKAILDGFTAIAFAATMGPGVCLAAIPVVLYQGGIALAAGSLQPYLSPAVLLELTGVGGILIIAIAFNLLALKEIKVANFLPAFLVVLLWLIVLLPLYANFSV